MATEIVMPKLSDTMTEGTFGAWKKGIGDTVQRGETIAEVETDKAVMDLEAFTSGVLLEQRVHSGQVVQVGTVIGLVGAPNELPVASGQTVAPSTQIGIGPERVMNLEKLLDSTPPSTAQTLSLEVKASHHDEQTAPVVRRRARELGIDLSLVQGSGPGGRILLNDLERFTGVSLTAEIKTVQNPSPASEPPVDEPGSPSMIYRGDHPTLSDQPVSRMRAAIARSVTQAWHEIPHFTVSVEVSMDAAGEVKRELKESGGEISVNDLVTKGSAMALQSFPLVNASFAGDRIAMHADINIGIAVSLPEGLLVPVLRDCQNLTLKEIASGSRRIVERARAGKLSEAELSGGTFSISNLGMYGVTAFTAIIHPTQSAILAVGAVREAIVAKNGQPLVSRVMNLTLSADHRLLDGAYAAEFLKELKHNLETPVRLLI